MEGGSPPSPLLGDGLICSRLERSVGSNEGGLGDAAAAAGPRLCLRLPLGPSPRGEPSGGSRGGMERDVVMGEERASIA